MGARFGNRGRIRVLVLGLLSAGFPCDLPIEELSTAPSPVNVGGQTTEDEDFRGRDAMDLDSIDQPRVAYRQTASGVSDQILFNRR